MSLDIFFLLRKNGNRFDDNSFFGFFGLAHDIIRIGGFIYLT